MKIDLNVLKEDKLDRAADCGRNVVIPFISGIIALYTAWKNGRRIMKAK